MPPKTPVAVSQRFVVMVTADLQDADAIPAAIDYLKTLAAADIQKVVAAEFHDCTVTCTTGGDTFVRQPSE